MNEAVKRVDMQFADIAGIEKSDCVNTGDEKNVDNARESTLSVETNCNKISNKRGRKKGQTIDKCPECKITFARPYSFRRHVSRIHPNLLTEFFPPVPKTKCDVCDKSFKCKLSLKTHRRRHHNLYLITKTHKCPLCPKEFEKKKLNKHFVESHNLILENEKLDFNNYEEFCSWKKTVERETNSYFAKKTTQLTNGTSRHFFICHRSGSFKSRAIEKKRKLKAKGSKKIDSYCPATIRVTEAKEGQCHVVFQGQHVGHKNEVKHLNLTLEERKDIAEMLQSGLPIDDVLNDIKNFATENNSERLFLITKKDLYNIRASCLKDKHPDAPAPHIISAKTISCMLEKIKKEHTESEHMKADVTNLENGWMITSAEDNDICFIKEKKTACGCPFICSDCKTCVHSYGCNCSGFSDKPNMCKHIHLLCMERNTNTVADANDTLTCDMSSDINQDDCLNDVNSSTSNKELNIDDRRSDITQDDCLNDISSSTSNELNIDTTYDFEEIFLEKKSNLKKKLLDLIDSVDTNEEYELFERHILELSAKLAATKTNDGATTVNNHLSDPVSTDAKLPKYSSSVIKKIICQPIIYKIQNARPVGSRICYVLNFRKVNNK